MIKAKLIVALIDSGSSVYIISDTLYKQLREASQIRMCNKIIIAANNGKMPIMGSADIQVQLQKFTCEIRVKFLVTRIEITPRLLGMEFLYNFDCILNLRKNELSASKDQIKKHYHKMSLLTHPDAGGDEEFFKTHNRAYQILMHDGAREAYSNFGQDEAEKVMNDEN